jgi:hypothetical protein
MLMALRYARLTEDGVIVIKAQDPKVILRVSSRRLAVARQT